MLDCGLFVTNDLETWSQNEKRFNVVKGSKEVKETQKGDELGKCVTEGQYSLLDRGGRKRRDKDNCTLGDGGRRE